MKKNFILFQIFIIALIFSIISCNNPLSFNTQSRKTDFPSAATGTVSGKLTFKGAIPQELIGKNTNSTSSKTAVPVFNMNCEYVITAYDPMNNPYPDITATFNDNHTEYSLKGIPLGNPCTVEVNVYKDASQAVKILTGKNTFTLTQESPIVSADVILEPIQTTTDSQSITRSVNLLIKVPAVSVGYVEAVNSQNLCSYICTHSDTEIYTLSLDQELQLSQSGPKSVTVNFYSGTNNENKGNLLYSFTETINIFDNLETNTWIKNADGTNSDPHLVLQDSQTMIADCIITQHLINNFTLTTFYVDTTAGSSTETGTSDNPFKTLQAAVDHINNYGNTTDSYTIYIKNNIDFESRILFINNIPEIRNITIAGYDGVKTIKRTLDNDYTLFEFSKESYNITLRDLILDGNGTQTTSSNGSVIKNASNLTLENVTIQKFISHRDSTGSASAGGAIYNGGTLTLKKSKILNCTSINDSSKAYGGAIYNGDSKTLILDDVVISGCKTQAGAASEESYGGGIYNAGTCKINKAIITGCSTIANSGSPGYAKGGAIYNTGSLTLGDSICNSDGSPDVTIGIGNYNGTKYSTPNEAFAGAGVFSGENASFTMNRDCVIGKFNPTTAPTKDNCGNRSCSTSLLGNGGAGVWISTNNTTMTINGGFISYNYAENTSQNNSPNSITGVGLYYKGNNLDNLEINNLTISYNNASTDTLTGPVAGVGISINSMKQIQLNNVKVYNNSGTPTDKIFGKGIYISESGSPIILKNSFWCSEDNDIYFNVSSTNHRQIQVNSILNPQNQFGVPQQYVATITPGDYASTTAYFTGSKVAENKDKFIISNNSAISYYINSNGKLFTPIGTKYPVSSFEVGDIVFNDGSATPYSVIKSRDSKECTDAEKKAAIAVIFRVGDGSDGNKTLGMGIKIDSQDRWCQSDAKGYNFKFNTSCIPDNSDDKTGNLIFNNSSNKDGSKNLKIIVTQLEQNNSNDTGLKLKEDGTIDFEKSDKNTFKQNYYGLYFAYYYGKDEIQGSPHNTKDTAYETGWYLPSLSELNDIYQANKNNEGDIYKASVAAGGNGMGTSNHLSSSQGVKYDINILYFSFESGQYIDGDKRNATHNVRAVRAFD